MSPRSRRLVRYGAFVVTGALVAGLTVALIHRRGKVRVDLGGRALIVRPALSPRDPQFGDTVTASLEVYADSAKIDPASVRFRTGFTPYAIVSTKRAVDRIGSVAVVRLSSRIRCLTLRCLPGGKVKAFVFRPIRVSYQQGSAARTTSAAWPALHVHSRVSGADLARPVLRVPPPVAAPPRYRVSPDVAGYGLLALAALLAVGGAALLLRVGFSRIVPVRRRVPPLERALVEVSASCSNGDSGRRRRALESLARELEPIDEPLSVESRVLAWGPGDPRPEAVSDLAARVRTAVRP